MRTVDPEQWSHRLKRPDIEASRCNRFGQQPGYRYETIFRESVVDAAVEYWRNCSVPAVKYINKEDANKCQRCCYILLLFVTVGSAIFVVSYSSRVFYLTPPLAISGQSSPVPIAEVSFPSVAVCSNNVISRKAFDNYTEFLYNHPKNKRLLYTRGEIENHLLALGALLMWSHPPLKLKFDKFLQDADPNFNVTDVMFKFSPPCASVIERCSWRGRLVPCDTLFAIRVTPLGFCCVFNSRYYPEDADNEPYVLDLIGQNYGLGLVVTENRDNFKYVRRNTFGAEMLLFEGSEYPLLQGGDVRLYPLPRNYSMFVNVRAVIQQYNRDVLTFSEKWRQCRTEGAGRSQCLAQCWRDTAAALCGCVPYTLHASTSGDGRRVCSLRDLPCLNKHREKFLYQYPAESVAPSLRQELQDGLSCGCVVACRRRLYSAHFSYSKYSLKPRIYRNFLTEGLALINSSTVRMFYNAEHHESYTLEAYARWHEVLAKLSTQWILLAGISVVTIMELVYHCTLRWLHHFIRRMRLSQPSATSTSHVGN